MKVLSKLMVLAVAALIVGQLLAGRSRPKAVVGQEAPAFSLPDLSGRKVDLAGLRGQVVVVNFWATWCGPCMMEAPELADFWQRNHGRCLETLGVAEESGSAQEIAQAASGWRIPYPVLVDGDGSVAERYRVPGYPRTYVIDGQGKVRRILDGAVRREELEAAVKPLLPPSPDTCPRA